MTRTRLAVALLTCLGLAACSGGGGGAASPAATPPVLAGTSWVLSGYAGPSAAAVSAPPSPTSTLRFGSDGTVSGSTGCNRFSGTYTQDGGGLTVALGPMTMMACTDPALQAQETAVVSGLAATRSVVGDADGGIELRDEAGASLLRYRAGAAGLAGTSWVATGINNGKEAVVSEKGTELVTAVFGEDGTVSGSAACNTYTGPFTEAGPGQVAIGPLATTRKACEPALMAIEASYLAAVEAATAYDIDGDTLTLRDADGATQVTYTAG